MEFSHWVVRDRALLEFWLPPLCRSLVSGKNQISLVCSWPQSCHHARLLINNQIHAPLASLQSTGIGILALPPCNEQLLLEEKKLKGVNSAHTRRSPTLSADSYAVGKESCCWMNLLQMHFSPLQYHPPSRAILNHVLPFTKSASAVSSC